MKLKTVIWFVDELRAFSESDSTNTTVLETEAKPFTIITAIIPSVANDGERKHTWRRRVKNPASLTRQVTPYLYLYLTVLRGGEDAPDSRGKHNKD
jgi:hypothetical protein